MRGIYENRFMRIRTGNRINYYFLRTIYFQGFVECKCFARKCYISQGNANVFQENAKFLVETQMFCERTQMLSEEPSSFSRKCKVFPSISFFSHHHVIFGAPYATDAEIVQIQYANPSQASRWFFSCAYLSCRFIETFMMESNNPMASFNLHACWTHCGSIGLPACVRSVSCTVPLCIALENEAQHSLTGSFCYDDIISYVIRYGVYAGWRRFFFLF